MTSSPARGRSLLWNIVKMVLAGFLVIYILSRTDLDDLAATFRHISVPWLMIMVLVYLGLTLLKALQYYVLTGGAIRYSQILNVVVLQNAVSNFVATGAGIASLVAALRLEHSVKVGRSMSMFLLTKIGDLIAIWLVLLSSSFLVWASIDVLQIPVLVLTVGIGFILAVFVLTVVYRQRTVTLIRSMLDRLKLSSIGILAKGMDALQALAEIDAREVRGKLLATVAISVIYLAVTIFSLYANLRVFGVEVDVLGIIFAASMLQLVSYLPIQIFGGLGISETSILYFLGIFHVSQDILAPALIGMRILFYFLNLIALIYLPIYTVLFAKKPKL